MAWLRRSMLRSCGGSGTGCWRVGTGSGDIAGVGSNRDGPGAAGRIEFALEALDVAAEIGGGLVTEFAVFFEGFTDDALELGGKIGIEANRRDGLAVHDGFKDYGGTFAAERKLSG